LFSINLNAQKFNTSVFQLKLSKLESIAAKNTYVDSILKSNSLSSKEESFIHHNYANFLFNSNLTDESFYHLKKAIKLREVEGDIIALKKSLFNLGFYYRKSGLVFKSINTFLELSELPVEDRLRMKSYSELITLYEKIGDFEKSKLYFQKSTEYYIAQKDYRNLYKNYMRISKVYASLDKVENFVEIINYLTKANSLSQFTTIEKSDESLINLRLGNVYVEVGKTDKAIVHYKKALQLSKELNDSLSVAMLNNNIGDLYLNVKQFSKAQQYLQSSIQFSGKDSESLALAYSTSGACYLQLQEFDSAKQYFEQAIQLHVEGHTNNDFVNPQIETLSNLPNKLRVLDFLTQKANYWSLRYKHDKNKTYLQKALQDFKIADQLLDIIRFESSEKKSKLFWREKGADLYIKAVEVCYLLKTIDDGYYFMEKNKALLLLEELNEQRAQVLSNLPKELVERNFTFKQKIIQAEESSVKDKVDVIFNLKRAYEQFKDSIANNYPDYSILRKQLPVLNSQNHKDNFINTTSATLNYIINETHAFGLVMTKDDSYLFKIDNVVVLQQNIYDLLQELQYPFETQFEVEAYVKNASSIFNDLLPNLVFDKLKGKRITISADGIIQNLPFEALITNSEVSNSYMIKSNEMNYVYSFSYLNLNTQKTRIPKRTFLGMAPRKFKDKNLATLTHSVDEINYVNSIFSDQVFSNEEASKYNFVSNVGDYKIIHLATHSGANDTEKPWLAFSDSKVNLNELYATKNQADLVVLSACKTSQGEIKSGEGVMSLARGFLYSGTKSVISTLWNINDKTTQEIMHSFYTNLKKGMTKSKALHESKITYLSMHNGTLASPYYWSSYVLIGDMGTISLRKKYNTTLILSILLSAILLVLVFYFRVKKT
jgi:CHAT domain-containing protein/predicted negative regulator of RcsB-dependent stress response